MPISGLEKSSSFRPAARSMARAGARCAPSVRAVLRGFNELSDTAAFPPESQTQKRKAIIFWMMARKSFRFSGALPSPACDAHSKNREAPHDHAKNANTRKHRVGMPRIQVGEEQHRNRPVN